MPEVSGAEWALVERQLTQLDADMREIRASVSTLVALHERQTALLERMNSIQGRVDDHEKRLRDIEKHQPGLRETRGWLIAALAAVASTALTLGAHRLFA